MYLLQGSITLENKIARVKNLGYFHEFIIGTETIPNL